MTSAWKELVVKMQFVLLKITRQVVNVQLVTSQILFPMSSVFQLKPAMQIFVTQLQFVRFQTVEQFANVHPIILEILTRSVVACKSKATAQGVIKIVQKTQFVIMESVSIHVRRLAVLMHCAKLSIENQSAHAHFDLSQYPEHHVKAVIDSSLNVTLTWTAMVEFVRIISANLYVDNRVTAQQVNVA